MLSRPRNWLASGVWKPKNPHSLEHLKYLYTVLCKNQTVTENNRELLVETVRSISEILIWGDQNDSTVFDFFLEKNMLSFFLRFMKQKHGRYICWQLLQTLSILVENVKNETSVYYLLSNNHINSIIVHKFDFSDEEVMAYYISFLKSLSLRLNKHTIHFFYNEHTNDFPLYTEAIKFFNHSEPMVRVAVRTITLNIYKVVDKSMLRYIRDKTAAPYFSNLVWFIGNNVLSIDLCLRHDTDHNSKERLCDFVVLQCQHLEYLQDIFSLSIDPLNEVLTDHLLNNLIIPLHVFSLIERQKYSLRTIENPTIRPGLAVFLLSKVFLIFTHKPLVNTLAEIIFNRDLSMLSSDAQTTSTAPMERRVCGFVKPVEPLAKTLAKACSSGGRPMKRPNYRNTDEPETDTSHSAGNSTFYGTQTQPKVPDPTPKKRNDSEVSEATEAAPSETSSEVGDIEESADPVFTCNVTDDEKLASQSSSSNLALSDDNGESDQQLAAASDSRETTHSKQLPLENRPFLQVIYYGLQCDASDYDTLLSLCFFYALCTNTGVEQENFNSLLLPEQSGAEDNNVNLIENLIQIINSASVNDTPVRLVTLELSIMLLSTLVLQQNRCALHDAHLAAIEGAREEATLQLRNFYKVWSQSEEIFLDMFEDEYRKMKSQPLNFSYLTEDASLLLPPTGTPLTGIDFNKRLPCGEVERAKKAIRVFFFLRELSKCIQQQPEEHLPLTKVDECVKVEDVLDLNNSDLIACTVINQDNKKERRFLVIDVLQVILVEPDSRKLGWGLVKFVGFLQDVEVTGDKEDSRSLHITIHKPFVNVHAKSTPLLSAKFAFDDHIRCMAAKQRLTKGRLKARQRKMQMIARLLELPDHLVEGMYQAPAGGSTQSAVTLRTGGGSSTASHPGRSHQVKMRPKDSSKTGPTKSRYGQSGAAVKQLTGGKSIQQPSDQAMMRGSFDTSSSEEKATLIKSVKASAASVTSVIQKKKAVERVPVASREVPLEDISARASKLLSGTRELFGHRQLDYSEEVVSRRQRSASSSDTSSSDRSRGSSRSSQRGRAGSCPSPEPNSPKLNLSSHNNHTGVINSDDSDTPKRYRHKSFSKDSPCPKTLTPAQEPALSLVSCDVSLPSHISSVDSPILVPPIQPMPLNVITTVTDTILEQESATNTSVIKQTNSTETHTDTSQPKEEKESEEVNAQTS